MRASVGEDLASFAVLEVSRALSRISRREPFSGELVPFHLPNCPSDRAYRTRRFESVTLAPIDQRRKAERCEVTFIYAAREAPRAA